MLLLIDNYDSFTYNLVHYFGELGAEVSVYRNDQLSVDKAISLDPLGIILSPGPSEPCNAGICVELVKKVSGLIPILGVCLGHQAIGEALGGKIVRAESPVHGKTSEIVHDGSGVFKDIPSPFTATRYHSLVIEKNTLPKELKIVAETADGSIMGITHESMQTYGVQFHPESIASEHGYDLLKNFLNLISEGASLP